MLYPFVVLLYSLEPFLLSFVSEEMPVCDKIIHKDLSYLVNGCIFDVHNDLGPGLREECYQKAMEHRLGQAGLSYVAKPQTRRELVYRDVVADVFEPDLVVAEKLIPELKHQPDGFARENYTQLLSYLKHRNLSLGLLVNFALDRAIIERIPYDPRNAPVEENYDFIRDLIQPSDRPVLRAVRDGLLEINQGIGVGYASRTYRNLAIIELRARGLDCDAEVEVTPTFRDRVLPKSHISPLLVNACVLVEIEALYDEVSARAIRTMQTHLRVADRRIGLVVGFGRTRFMIRGVRQGKGSNE